MVSFEGTDSWDFFANDFMTHLPAFSPSNQCEPKTVGKFNAQETDFIFQVSAADLARHPEDGATVNTRDIYFPFFMRFKPRAGLP